MNAMKKIMILGASVYQVPLIKKAKDMGLYTIVSSIPGNYPGFALADKVYHINTVDREGTLAAAMDEGIDGIITAGTDVAVPTIGYVNEHMGLSGVSEEAAQKTSDKTIMKTAFRDGGVSASEFVIAHSYEEARDAAERIGFPVVVKCVDSSGSRGITSVYSEAELKPAFEKALGYSRKNYVLVEERLRGTEIGVDGFVRNGEMILFAPHHKFAYSFNNITMPAGHAFPYECSETVRQELAKQIKLAVAALGLDNCAFNADVFVDGDRVYIIEMGGRSGATCIPELISIHFGFDFYELMIKCAMGERISIDTAENRTPCMAKLLMSPADGVISAIDNEGIDRLCSEKVTIRLDYGPGQAVEAMKNGTTRIGHVICATDSEARLDEIMQGVYSNIYVDGRKLSELWKR